jgi:hypothetical protein
MFDLPETITVWNKGADDGFGGITWTAPITYDARIAFKSEKFTDTNGDQLLSTAVCYTEGATVYADSLVLFGESLSVSPDQSADDVRQISQTPSGAGAMKKLWFA